MARNQKLEEVRLSIKSALSKVQGNQKIKYGKDELYKIAKLNFKNTEKILNN